MTIETLKDILNLPPEADTLIKVDGSTFTAQPAHKMYTLAELQTLVGGYVTPVAIPTDPDLVMLVDEDGIPKQLEINQAASVLATQTICGDAFILHRSRFDR